MSLVWTKEPPTEPGWYWAKGKSTPPSIAMVYLGGTSPFLDLRGAFNMGETSNAIRFWFSVAEWAGPIPEPTEPTT